MKKVAATWLSLLFLFSLLVIIIEIAPQTGATTIYVDDSGGADYLKIQDAINASSDGDRVFVYSGTYYENIVINKTINLTGEDKYITIIDGGEIGHVVKITADFVNLTGFTVNNSGKDWEDAGIELYYVQGCNINNNIILNNHEGIHLTHSNFNINSENYFSYNTRGILVKDSDNNTIINNLLLNNNAGIYQDYSNNNNISYNDILDGHHGIVFWNSNDNYITYNRIINKSGEGISIGHSNNNYIASNHVSYCNWKGIDIYSSIWNNIYDNYIFSNVEQGVILGYSSWNNISGNKISSNSEGIWFTESSENKVIDNQIIDNNHGIYIYPSASINNTIYHNNFINNLNHSNDPTNNSNKWDNGYPSGGNYWDNYTGVDNNEDGLGDTPYEIDSNSWDNYPLINPVVIDVVSPTINIISPSNNSMIQPGEHIILSISDPHLSIVNYSVDIGAFETFNTPYVIDTTYWNEGEHLIEIYSSDFFNNENSAFFNITIDKLSPMIVLNTPGNNSIFKPGIIINLTISDLHLDEVLYSTNGGASSLLISPYDITTNSWEDGNYIITINATDHAGNLNSTWFNFTIDSTPPDIVLNSPENNSFLTGIEEINLTILDVNLKEVMCSINGNTVFPLYFPYDINTSTWIDGIYIITLNATDIVYNFNLIWFNFTIDSTPPDIILNSPENNSFLTDYKEINLTLSDNHLNNVTYSVNGDAPTTLYSPYNINTSSWSEGNYTIIVNSEDFAGNFNERIFNFNKDTISPEITLNSPDNGSLLIETSILDFEVLDPNLYSVRYSINQASHLNFEEPFDLEISDWEDGDYTITIKAEDSASHISERWFSFKIDISEPSIVSTSIVNGQTDVSIGVIIEIEFSEPMDTTSVESTISISPDVECSYSWSNNRTLTVNFSGSLEYETLYKISISNEAKDTVGKGLETEFEIEFTTQKMPRAPGKEEGLPMLYLALILILAVVVFIIIVALVMAKKKKTAPEVTGPQEITEVQAEEGRAIPIKCSNCNNLLSVMDIGAPHNVTCPFCSTVLAVGSRTATAEESPTQQETLAEPQPEPQTQAQQPTINISCPRCSYKFSVVKTEGAMKVQCPNCGAKGSFG